MPIARSRTNWVSLIAIGLAGFALTAALIHPIFGDSLRLYSQGRSEKLYLLDHIAGTLNAADFGSSRSQDGFDPSTFDRELAERGRPVRTINLAIYGGSQTEERAMAREFLKRSPPGDRCSSCLILFEYSAGANLQPENLVNPRAINLYDLDTARFAFHYSGPEAGRTQRLGRAAYGVAGSLLHAINLGMLSNKIFQPPMNQELLANYSGDDRRGRIVDTVSLIGNQGVAEAFQESSTSLPVVAPAKVPPGAYRLLADTTRSNPGRELRFIYYVAPTLSSLKEREQLPCTVDGPSGPVPILNLDRPDRFPELFTPVMWHDFGHLNDRGAVFFTSLLAKQVNDWLDGTPPTGCGG